VNATEGCLKRIKSRQILNSQAQKAQISNGDDPLKMLLLGRFIQPWLST
jgi:hypothetical protein